jgi:hypothetical protein
MALRKPLVQISGLVQQLPAGDELDAAVAGGDRTSLTNGEAGAVVIGAPVYMFGADTYKKAQANAGATFRAIALASAVTTAAAASGEVILNGVLVATPTQWDAVVTGGAGGLVFGAIYYVDPANAGKLVPTAPSTVGQYIVPVGEALSTTELMVSIGTVILL